MKRYTLLVLLIIIGWFSGRAQTSHLYFDKIGIKEGLPESNVRTIKEDAEGYIWIATQNGLVRYDGYRYKVYELGSDKTNVRPTTNVQSIFIARDNTIWISTSDNGVFRYNRSTDSFIQFAYPSATTGNIFFIDAEDNSGNLWGRFFDGHNDIAKLDTATGKFEPFGKEQKGAHYLDIVRAASVQNLSDGIWIGSDNNGLYHYQGPGKPFKGYLTTTDTAKQRGVNPVYEAPSQPGILWLNTFHGANLDLRLTRLDVRANSIKEFRGSRKPDSLLSAGINNIYEDKQRRLWFATDHGLTQLNRKSGAFTNYVPDDTLKSQQKNNLAAFTEASDGSFWLSSGTGLINFNPATRHFERYIPDAYTKGATNGNTVDAKIIDHTNTLWVTYAFAGVNKEDKLKSAFQIIKKTAGNRPGYPDGLAQVIPEKKGYSFVNNGHGIYEWLDGTDNFKLIYAVEKGQYIDNFIAGANGILYLGTSDGMVVYNPATGKKEQYKATPGDTTNLNYPVIAQLFQDHTGTVWLAMENHHGLCSFNPNTKKFTRYKCNQNITRSSGIIQGALDDNQVLSIYEDHENTLWIGTNEGSINRFDRKTGKFYSFYNDQNKKMYCIVDIHEDNAGRFWVGTYLSGLFEFDRKKGTYINHFDEQSGLLHNSISDIKEDHSGQLWILTSRGISKLNPKTAVIKNFELSKLLPGYELNGLNSNLFKLPGDTLVLTLSGAMAVFDTKSLNDVQYPPRVHLETVSHSNPLSGDETVTQISTYGIKSLELPYNQNRLQFNYVGIQFDDPSQNTYAYKLENYDEQWVQAGTGRSVTYNNLSPGTYVFHVIAANSSGVWNYQGDSITIVIAPPWWQRWWAWFLYVMLFAWAIYSFIAYRSRKLLKENKLLEEKVGLRTAQLSEANKELSEQREEIITQRDRLAETVVDLKTTQNQLIQAEKMASLGELTAGIAHEIQNPLNFVNNFSEVSIELLQELKQEEEAGNKEDVIAIVADLTQNLEKINHHGKRADAIVKGMLKHSRAGSGVKEPTDINKLADEYLRLSYHGMRSKDKSFNAELVINFDENLPRVNVIPQDIGRVLLNLFNNAFYAVNQKAKTAGPNYLPEVLVTTFHENGKVNIVVKDNGIGIEHAIKDKILQPFFTTKPTGEGTGLGLSLSYDIVVKANGGNLQINSTEGQGAEFIITLPII